MYKVISDGEDVGYTDTVVYVRLHENGCYIPCDEAEADGFCVKLPYEYTDEEENAVRTLQDTVFAIPGHVMHGEEAVAELSRVEGALLMSEAEQVVTILLGGMDA